MLKCGTEIIDLVVLGMNITEVPAGCSTNYS